MATILWGIVFIVIAIVISALMLLFTDYNNGVERIELMI
jgi:hypothetical protein